MKSHQYQVSQCPLCVPWAPEGPGVLGVQVAPGLHRRTTLCQTFLGSQASLALPVHLDIPFVQQNLWPPWAPGVLGVLGSQRQQSRTLSWTQSFQSLLSLLSLLWVLVFHVLAIRGTLGVPGLLAWSPLDVLESQVVLVGQAVLVPEQRQTVSQLWTSSQTLWSSLISLRLPCHP